MNVHWLTIEHRRAAIETGAPVWRGVPVDEKAAALIRGWYRCARQGDRKRSPMTARCVALCAANAAHLLRWEPVQ